MDTQTHLLSTLNSEVRPQFLPVVVDCFAWLQVNQMRGEVVMDGVRRHNRALCSLYWPVYSLAPDEQDFDAETIAALSLFLGKQITRVNHKTITADYGTTVWVSPAVDFIPPWITERTSFLKIAILHDAMGFNAVGDGRRERFFLGAKGHDVFAYVSTWALHTFSQNHRLRANQQFIRYGGFHEHETLPTLSGVRESDLALSVHSINPNKNLSRARQITQSLNIARHIHVGHAYSLSEEERMALLLTGLQFAGHVSDEALAKLYRTAQTFICASKDEGFSLPAMEAILHGVPVILLSDIPAHFEIYSDFNVTFFPVTRNDPISYTLTVPEAQRVELFRRHHRQAVMKDLKEFIANQI